MRTSTLIRRNLRYYWRTNLAMIAGVATAVAVLAGALLVGDSVRGSLRDLFLTRLGRTDHVISSGNFFREELAHDLRAAGFACPMIALAGLVTHEESGRRASGVHVYGVDERFWRFHAQQDPGLQPGAREALISPGLVAEIGGAPGDTILVRVEMPSAIPQESLHGRKTDSGRTMRFSVHRVLPASGLGEFTIHPEQGSVRAVFVPLGRLQRDLGQEGRANTILLSAGAGGQTAAGPLEEALQQTYKLEDLSIRLRVLASCACLSLEKGSVIIDDALAEPARAAATALGMRVTPVFTYLANSIRVNGREAPYSLVAAVDLEQFAAGGDAAHPAAPPIVLNEWAARELHARPGDTVTLEYYLWKEEGRLVTESAKFQLRGVVPMTVADRDLAPEYPGITEAESLGDWDPPFPIDLKRIRPQDEDYWKLYRTTPKALVPLAEGQRLWQSRFGKLTSLRLYPALSGDLQPSLEAYRGKLRASLDPLRAGLAVSAVRAEGLQAARGATDFGLYFLYFSFFLVGSGLLLAGLFFKLGIEQRLREIGLLRAIGFSIARIRVVFITEGLVLAGSGCLIGAGGAVGYGALVLLGLRTWWVDAVGTRLLELHVSPLSLAAGAASGLAAALLVIVWVLRGLRAASPRRLLTGEREVAAVGAGGRPSDVRRIRLAAVACGLAAIVLLAAAAARVANATVAFFIAGVLLLAAFLCFQWLWLAGRDQALLHARGTLGLARFGFRNARYRPGRSILCIALIAFASFTIFAVQAFRREGLGSAEDRHSGTGGFALLAESLLPLYYDPNSEAGRDNLNLAGRNELLRGVRFVSFRVRQGDDASCLNLYQPRNPRVLGAPADFINSGRFSFQASLAATPEEKANPWLLLGGPTADGAVPAIADANSMTYVLHRELGEEITIYPQSGRPVRLRLVGALRDSVFQRELVISEANFLRLFPDPQGFRFFLLDVPRERVAQAAGALEEALSDFGFDATESARFLAGFHRVENTYLATFQALGGLGLLLGTAGLAAVLMRNVLERRRELALLLAVGYRSSHLRLSIIAENLLLLGAGLGTGTICAFLAIAPAFFERGGRLATGPLAALLLAVLLAGLAASVLATAAALRAPLIPALKAE